MPSPFGFCAGLPYLYEYIPVIIFAKGHRWGVKGLLGDVKTEKQCLTFFPAGIE
jgi:hypothetical protein